MSKTNGTTTNEATADEYRAARTGAAARTRTRKTAAALTVGTAAAQPRAARTTTTTPAHDPLMSWARAGVGLCLTLSAGLNGWANAEHCAPGMGAAGWALGVCVPGLVLILSRVSGGAWQRGRRGLGATGAAVVLLLLALSVKHCAHTFAQLTGSDAVSAVLWAIGVDVGLVVCELFTLNRKGR
jgi:hypothetical protein